MALSTEEHALLVETCDNMNASAEVNREVLELVRNLGNTGVVDIATHNSADNAHANSAGLLHIDPSTNTVTLGSPGLCNDKDSYASSTPDMFRLLGGGGFYPTGGARKYGDDLVLLTSSYNSDITSSIYSYYLETDASGNAAEKKTSYHFSINASYYYLDNNEIKVKRCMWSAKKAVGGTGSGADHSMWVMQLWNGTSNANILMFQPSAIAPASGSTVSLGISGRPFSTAYLSTEPTIGSDRRVKANIAPLGSDAVNFIKALRPVQFTLKEGTKKVVEADEQGEPLKVETAPGVRTHWGLIAQEVKEAMNSAGIEDAAVWCLEDKNDPDSKQSIRYGELIAPMIKVIQQQQERIEALERRLA